MFAASMRGVIAVKNKHLVSFHSARCNTCAFPPSAPATEMNQRLLIPYRGGFPHGW